MFQNWTANLKHELLGGEAHNYRYEVAHECLAWD